MTDILHRLRDLSPSYGNVIKDSVEEIERLRAELERVRFALANRTDPDWKVLADARAALPVSSHVENTK